MNKRYTKKIEIAKVFGGGTQDRVFEETDFLSGVKLGAGLKEGDKISVIQCDGIEDENEYEILVERGGVILPKKFIQKVVYLVENYDGQEVKTLSEIHVLESFV